MKESVVSFEEKTTQLGLLTFKLLSNFKTNPLNIIFDDFSIWLGYRTKFSCLYLPQAHNFISTVWLWSTDEYVMFWFWAKVHL